MWEDKPFFSFMNIKIGFSFCFSVYSSLCVFSHLFSRLFAVPSSYVEPSSEIVPVTNPSNPNLTYADEDKQAEQKQSREYCELEGPPGPGSAKIPHTRKTAFSVANSTEP